MSKKFLTLTSLAGAVLLAAVVSGCGSSSNDKVPIAGVLTDDARRPISGAGVFMDSARAILPARAASTVTDAAGRFEVEAEPGTIKLAFDDHGRLSSVLEIEVEQEDTFDLEIQMGDDKGLHADEDMNDDGRIDQNDDINDDNIHGNDDPPGDDNGQGNDDAAGGR